MFIFLKLEIYEIELKKILQILKEISHFGLNFRRFIERKLLSSSLYICILYTFVRNTKVARQIFGANFSYQKMQTQENILTFSWTFDSRKEMYKSYIQMWDENGVVKCETSVIIKIYFFLKNLTKIISHRDFSKKVYLT